MYIKANDRPGSPGGVEIRLQQPPPIYSCAAAAGAIFSYILAITGAAQKAAALHKAR